MTMALKSPNSKNKNSSLTEGKPEGGSIEGGGEFVSPQINNENILQIEEAALNSKIKLSRSLKALKSNSKRRHISKDLKQSIDQLLHLQ